MCSVWGFVARRGATVDTGILAKVAKANATRGPHAFGWAWVCSKGRLHHYKQSGDLRANLRLLGMLHGAKLVIGHQRWATHGHVGHNVNNHPHPVDGGHLVHNGVIGNHRELVEAYRLWMNSECDSEVLGLLVEQSENESQAGRVIEAVNAVESSSGLVALALWNKPQSIVAVRRGNPLHVGEVSGGLYLGSVLDGLPGDVRSVEDNTCIRFTLRGYAVDVESYPVESHTSHRVYNAKTYAGG
jgi:glucosamine 6-phosphate synthetase-like amidotransferase/phosphosugar isomerase protein